MEKDGSSTELVERWRQGDEAAATELYRRYLAHLLRVVSNHLGAGAQARVDPDDILQSAFRSMFCRFREGQFEFQDDADVWRLMVTVTLNKLRRRVRHIQAGKRNPNREVALGGEDDGDAYVMHCLARQPSVREVAEFNELLEGVFGKLPSRSQELLRLRLEGYEQQEIADRLGICTRTIRRMWDDIRDEVAHLMA